MALKVEKQDNKFRVLAQEFNSEWIPDILANRQTMVVMLRLLKDQNGKKLFTLKELAQITKGETTTAAAKTVKKFEQREQNFQKLHVFTKPKIDEEVIDEIKKITIQNPLISLEELARQSNLNLNRDDINRWDVEWVLDQYVGYYEIRKVIKKRLGKGQYNYKEGYVLNHLVKLVEQFGQQDKIAFIPLSARKEWKKATESIESFAQPEISTSEVGETAQSLFKGKIDKENLSRIWESQTSWYLWAFILYYNGVSLSVIGSWFGVHKSTVSRWLTKFGNWSEYWISTQCQKVSSSLKIAVDEKWIKVNNSWWYLFAAVDCTTNYPLHVAIYPGNGISYCKLFLLELKNKGYYPKVIITDGWDSYIKAIQTIFPNTEHLLCRFHTIKSVFRRLYLSKISDTCITNAVANLFKSVYKRTVIRRIAELKKVLSQTSSEHTLSGLEKKLPQVIKTVGSSWRPSTSNAVESFFSRFDRFYRLKGPFQNKDSAQKHLSLFMLGYLFSIGASGQASPLEQAGHDVASVPLYHLLNRPNILILKERMAA